MLQGRKEIKKIIFAGKKKISTFAVPNGAGPLRHREEQGKEAGAGPAALKQADYFNPFQTDKKYSRTGRWGMKVL